MRAQHARNEWIVQQWALGLSPWAIIEAGKARRYTLTRSMICGVVKRARDRGDIRCAIRKPERTVQRATEQRRRAFIPVEPAISSGTLGKGGCRWICGEIKGLDTPTCGAPLHHNHSWCEAHCAVAFDKRHYKPSKGRAA